MEQIEVGSADPLEVAAHAWRTLVDALGPLSFEFSGPNARAITSLINRFLASGKFVMREPVVVFLMSWLSDYETRYVHLSEAAPRDVLRQLMGANGLKQVDLAPELGGQSVVSEILNGRREINARQASALAARFGVSAAVFIAALPTEHAAVFQHSFTSAREMRVQPVGLVRASSQYSNQVYATRYQ